MFKIAYCAGHWLGNSKGVPTYMGLGSIREWTLNDQVARHFERAALEYEGVEIMRLDDSTGMTAISLADRCAKANAWGADFALEIHHNGGIKGGKGGGVVAYSHPNSKNGKQYRDAIYKAVIAAGGLKGNRAEPLQAKKWDFVSMTKMPAVLMEYGFMDSKTDAPIIITDAHAKMVAYATMEGIAKIAGLKKREAKPAETKYTMDLRQLKKGCEGEDVRALQILLNGRGYLCGKADGIFGTKTDEAVREFQRDNQIGADGIAGLKTMSALLGKK